jgi:hypothetical protein
MFDLSNVDKLAKNLFGKSEVKNRIGLNAAKMITGDMVTLYGEFKQAKGVGILCFNPSKPDKSVYMTLDDLRVDLALAEEMCDTGTSSFLAEAIKIVQKYGEKKDTGVIVLVSDRCMSLHVLDLNDAEERLNNIVDAASND